MFRIFVSSLQRIVFLVCIVAAFNRHDGIESDGYIHGCNDRDVQHENSVNHQPFVVIN